MSSDLPSRDSDYQAPPAPARMVFDRAVYNHVFGDIALRLRTIEAQRTDLQAVINDLRLFGLQRLDEAIVPLIDDTEADIAALQTLLNDTIAQTNQVVADFQAQTNAALADLDTQIDTAIADMTTQINLTIDQLEADVAAAQLKVDQLLAGGVPAADILEDETRVFVTPAEKAEIGQLRADLVELVGGAPGALDTLNELAAALGDDTNFAATVTNSLAGKAEKLAVSTISGNSNAAAGNCYLCDTAAAGFTIAFPAAPADGDTIEIVTVSSAEANNVTIDLNGKSMDGSTDNIVIAVPVAFLLQYRSGAWWERN